MIFQKREMWIRRSDTNLYLNSTKMHSSRMRTVRCSSRLWGGGGGVCFVHTGIPPGQTTPLGRMCLPKEECVCPGGGVSAEGGLPGGGGSAQEGCLLGGIPVCTEADTPPPCGQNSSHMFVKILHCHNFVADGNNEKIYQYLFICI